jgi:hypothetical protein
MRNYHSKDIISVGEIWDTSIQKLRTTIFDEVKPLYFMK